MIRHQGSKPIWSNKEGSSREEQIGYITVQLRYGTNTVANCCLRSLSVSPHHSKVLPKVLSLHPPLLSLPRYCNDGRVEHFKIRSFLKLALEQGNNTYPILAKEKETPCLGLMNLTTWSEVGKPRLIKNVIPDWLGILLTKAILRYNGLEADERRRWAALSESSDREEREEPVSFLGH